MIKYPVSFYSTAESPPGVGAPWTVETRETKSLCAIPLEFEGPGGAHSPEDLFSHALTNCFIGTFKVYAEKSRIKYSNLSVKTELVVDLNEAKKPVMKRCFLHVVVSGCESPDRVKTIAEKSLQSGFIINSVKTEVAMDLSLVE